MTARVDELLAQESDRAACTNQCFWHACQGGQLRTARQLLALGADIAHSPDYAGELPVEAALSPGTGRSALASWLAEQASTD